MEVQPRNSVSRCSVKLRIWRQNLNLVYIVYLATEKPSVAIDFQRVTGHLGNVTVSKESVVGVEVPVNGHLTLPYKVDGFPWPTVEWSHDNSTLDDSKYNVSHLTLDSVELSDAGVYDVVVKSPIGRAQASFYLSVRGK